MKLHVPSGSTAQEKRKKAAALDWDGEALSSVGAATASVGREGGGGREKRKERRASK